MIQFVKYIYKIQQYDTIVNTVFYMNLRIHKLKMYQFKTDAHHKYLNKDKFDYINFYVKPLRT